MYLENVPEPRSCRRNAKAQPATCSASERCLEHVPRPSEVNTSVHPGDLTFQKEVLRALVAVGILPSPSVGYVRCRWETRTGGLEFPRWRLACWVEGCFSTMSPSPPVSGHAHMVEKHRGQEFSSL